jgi:23S rRNA (adenine2503-C2)-methyltransferase
MQSQRRSGLRDRHAFCFIGRRGWRACVRVCSCVAGRQVDTLCSDAAAARRCKINLIVFNPHEGTPFRPSPPERVRAFRSLLIQVSSAGRCSHQRIPCVRRLASWSRCRSMPRQLLVCSCSGTICLAPANASFSLQGGHVATVRESRGDDSMAACGQLGSKELALRPPPLLSPPERLRGAVSVDLTA